MFSLRRVVLLQPGDDVCLSDESGPGQWRGTEIRVPRCEISAAIDQLAENVELPGAGGDVRRCPSRDCRTDAMVDHLFDECPPPEGGGRAE